MTTKRVWRIKVGDKLSCVCREVPLSGTVVSVTPCFERGVYVVCTDCDTYELNPVSVVETS
jgi:hypothetical protein